MTVDTIEGERERGEERSHAGGQACCGGKSGEIAGMLAVFLYTFYE